MSEGPLTNKLDRLYRLRAKRESRLRLMQDILINENAGLMFPLDVPDVILAAEKEVNRLDRWINLVERKLRTKQVGTVTCLIRIQEDSND